jgi:sulfate adenylyltransferase subunit 1 (EFTu-like GTPase family)
MKSGVTDRIFTRSLPIPVFSGFTGRINSGSIPVGAATMILPKKLCETI